MNMVVILQGKPESTRTSCNIATVLINMIIKT
jgi:hypothetical protein